MQLKLNEIAKVLGMSWRGRENPTVTSVSTDTRTLTPGALFIALSGTRFNGHDYLEDAQRQGAVAAVVSRTRKDILLPQIQVADTRRALGMLAAYWHRRCHTDTVAITGSVGKTTVKELLGALLAPNVCCTQGNYNNDIGVPLTLLREKPEDRFAVIEIGANSPGEIAYLTSLVRPRVGVITAIAPAHVKGFGSVAGVAQEKSALFQALPEDGVAVTTTQVVEWDVVRSTTAGRKLLLVSTRPNDNADLWIAKAEIVNGIWQVMTDGILRIEFSLPLLGQHNLQNAMLALAAASQLPVVLQDAVKNWAELPPVAGRMEQMHGPSGSILINDAYNASPASVRAAVDWLATQSGRRTLVLGDMAELGDEALNYHREIGQYAAQKGVERLFTIGSLSQAAQQSFGGEAKHFSDAQSLIAYLRDHLAADDVVLFKGSRMMALERVINGLLEKEQQEGKI